MGRKALNIIGDKYNLLTVLEEVEPYIQPNGIPIRKYRCQCECKNRTIVRQGDLRSGNTTSCGCKRGPHGHSKSANSRSATYRTWSSMKQRCLDSNFIKYENYGGRGITICNRWLNSFEAFLEDMGERPEGMTLDRIDSNGNYEPTNCRWATNQVQVLNRGKFKNNTSGHKGVKWYEERKRWLAFICANRKQKYLGSFKTKEEAITARLAAEEKQHKPLLEVC